MDQAGPVKGLELRCESKQGRGSCATLRGAIWSQPWFLCGLVRCWLGCWGTSLSPIVRPAFWVMVQIIVSLHML